MQGAGAALKKAGDSMPSSRKQELLQILKAHFGKEEVSNDDIDVAANLDTRQQ